MCSLKNIFFIELCLFFFAFSWIFIPFWEIEKVISKSEEDISKSLAYVCVLIFENNFY